MNNDEAREEANRLIPSLPQSAVDVMFEQATTDIAMLLTRCIELGKAIERGETDNNSAVDSIDNDVLTELTVALTSSRAARAQEIIFGLEPLVSALREQMENYQEKTDGQK